jgi:hypothetical protein
LRRDIILAKAEPGQIVTQNAYNRLDAFGLSGYDCAVAGVGDGMREAPIRKMGDMVIVDRPSSAKLEMAIETIALHVHNECTPGDDSSKRGCIACSLIVRDFLRVVGFGDADVLSVGALLTRGVHWKGVGIPGPGDAAHTEGIWQGHLIAVIPSEGYLIDTTLYRFSGCGMFSVPLCPPEHRVPFNGLPIIAQIKFDDVHLTWMERAHNQSWRHSPDAMKIKQRAAIVDRLVSLHRRPATSPPKR